MTCCLCRRKVKTRQTMKKAIAETQQLFVAGEKKPSELSHSTKHYQKHAWTIWEKHMHMIIFGVLRAVLNVAQLSNLSQTKRMGNLYTKNVKWYSKCTVNLRYQIYNVTTEFFKQIFAISIVPNRLKKQIRN